MLEKIIKAKDFINSKILDFNNLTIGLILGSGLGELANEIKSPVFIDYKDIPYFPQSTVQGHKGRFVYGNLEGKYVLAMQGRIHYYEGYNMQEVTFPVRVMQALGVKNLVITNAAGGLNSNFEVGDFMIIESHINFMGNNPLIGKNLDEFGPRFPSMKRVYDKRFQAIIKEVAIQEDIKLHTGVYIAVSGPNYETSAELKFFRLIGADAVGMSTVPEVLVAGHGGMKVLGLSCITNIVAPSRKDDIAEHEYVLKAAEKSKEDFKKLVKGFLRRL